MKKIIALLLAVIMVMGLATVVSANGDVEEPAAPVVSADDKVIDDASEDISFNFIKKYETTAGEVPATFPVETLKFAVTDSTEENAPVVTMVDHTVGSNPDNIVLTVGEATVPGLFEYTVVEVEGDTQGVTYDTTTQLKVTVLVYWAEETVEGNTTRTLKKQVTVTKPEGNAAKVDTIVNKYDLGDMSVTKTVTGNLGDKTVPFTIKVKFTAAEKVWSDITYTAGTTSEAGTITGNGWTGDKEVTITLKDGATVDFTNIPDGVTYTVIEDAAHKRAADAPVDPNSAANAGYKATGEVTTAKAIVVDDETAEEIVNNKETAVDTGIVMDSVPFIVMAVVAVIGLAAFTAKKRVQE